MDHLTLPEQPTTTRRQASLEHRSGKHWSGTINDYVPPSILDYEIGDQIGAGGMGVVFRATHQPTKRQIAIKFVNPCRLDQLSKKEAGMARDRFHQEARAAARIDHSGIVTVFDVRLDHDPPFYTMQLIDGPSLASILVDGPLVPVEAARLICQCARAIDAANEQGVVHRDIKPQNILISELEQSAFIADFGLAKLATDDIFETMDGELLGTPAYMSPEQSRSAKHATIQSDVYSLGATLYHAIAGRPPFHAATYSETIRLIHHSTPLSPRELDSSIPLDLESICLKCLEHDLGGRYTSAGDLADDLDRFLDHRPTIAKPISTIQKTRKWFHRNRDLGRSLFAVGVLLVAIMATLVTAVWVVRGQNAKLDSLLVSERLAKQNVQKALQNSYMALEPYLKSVYQNQGLLHDEPGYQLSRRTMLIQIIGVLENLCQQESNNFQMAYDLMNAYDRLGDIELLLGDPQAAVDAFVQAESQFDKAYSLSSDSMVTEIIGGFRWQCRLGEIIRDKAVAMSQTSKSRQADFEFTRAVAVLKSEAEEVRHIQIDERQNSILTYANALRMHGRYCLSNNRLGRARENLENAIFEVDLLVEQLGADTTYDHDLIYYRKDLALSYAFLGETYQRLGDPEMANHQLRKLEGLTNIIRTRIDENLYGVTNVRFALAQCQVTATELSMSLSSVIDVPFDESQIDEAIAILAELVEKNELVPSYRQWLDRARRIRVAVDPC